MEFDDSTSILTLYEIWFGHTSINAVKRAGDLKVVGATVFARSLVKQFPVSSFQVTFALSGESLSMAAFGGSE